MVRLQNSITDIILKENPVNNVLKIQVVSPDSKELKISVFSPKGEKLLQKRLTVPSGISLQNISVQQLSSGSYFLQVAEGQYFKTIKFTKTGK